MSRANRHRAISVAGPGALALVAAVVLLWRAWDSPSESGADLLAQARGALAREEYDLAGELASRVARGDDAWPSAQLVAGEAATRAGRLAIAIQHYSSIPRDGSPNAVLAAFSFGEVCREVGRLSETEEAYRYALEHQPGNAEAHRRMAFLLGVTGRRWESLSHFMALVRSGEWDLDSLALLGDLERPLEQGAYVRRCFANAPEDILVQLALAADTVYEGHSDEARRLLEKVVALAPHLIAAQAMLGELIVDADQTTFRNWHAALPSAAERHPDIWYVRGLWARRRGDLRVAARCFWETVRLAPVHRRGNYQLGQVLVLSDEAAGREFTERASQLNELTRSLDDVLRSRGRNQAAMRRVAGLMERTGRIWEAWAWAATAAKLFPNAVWSRSAVERLAARLSGQTPRVLDESNLALKYDLSALPGPAGLIDQFDDTPTPEAVSPRHSVVRFEEAVDCGIEFVYENGADLSTDGARMFEQTGGGAAVLDVDGDGWPDIYLTQGAAWTHGAKQPTVSPELIDRLYRNIGGRSFVDVTRDAGLGDPGFGQGAAAGDFDNDGFPDLYVANVGRNRLYRNNGDGTFSDVTDATGLSGDEWTASCVIVDLNADGFPDLFDVNYLTGPRVYELICNGRACSPKGFPGEPDRLHVSRGDGTFEFVPDATPSMDAKGLGVVAADLGQRGRPCLFIANDQVPNFLLRNEPSNNPFNIRLLEEGFVSGLAFNEDGLALAAMGIAADDVDGNGRIDFFVTNFKDESNTLYLQDAPGLFVDATNPAGLRAPSFPYVGWGTHFLDADLDGEPDLVLVNGHVDDYRNEGGEYHMRPQFFRNTGGGRFVELFAAEAGSWFEHKSLGRGLARLDWNRDGRMDFVVSRIGEPASLLTNESAGVGHFVNVRLHATATARDAIGSVVEVVAGDRRWSKQLVAGDGYMASNERVLQFGLGPATSVSELRVQWPSGAVTTLRELPVDVTIDLAERGPHAFARWEP